MRINIIAVGSDEKLNNKLPPNADQLHKNLDPYLDIKSESYWVTQKLPQICTVILRICIGKLAWFAVIFAVTSGSPSIYKKKLDTHRLLMWDNFFYDSVSVTPCFLLLAKIEIMITLLQENE